MLCVKRTQGERTLNKLLHLREAGNDFSLPVIFPFCSKCMFLYSMGNYRVLTELP